MYPKFMTEFEIDLSLYYCVQFKLSYAKGLQGERVNAHFGDSITEKH